MEMELDQLLRQATCWVEYQGKIATAWLFDPDGIYLLTVWHLFSNEKEECTIPEPLTQEKEPYVTVNVGFEDGQTYPNTAYRVAKGFIKDEVDFAILKLKEPVVHRQRLRINLALSTPKGKFQLRGYGTTLRQGEERKQSGRIGDFDAPYGKLFQLKCSGLNDAGYSGGAVYSYKLDAVVALQIRSLEVNPVEINPVTWDPVFAMPLYRVAEVWPQLKELAIKPQIASPQVKPTGRESTELKERLRNTLSSLNYDNEWSKFREFRNSSERRSQLGAWLIHGQCGSGHEWLSYRLANYITNRPDDFIILSFDVIGERSNSDSLWEELAKKVFKSEFKESNRKKIVQQLHVSLKTQNIVIICNNLQNEDQLNELMKNFWLPIAKESEGILKYNFWLLMFLTMVHDEDAEQKKWQSSHLTEPPLTITPLPIASKFCYDKIITWFNDHWKILNLSGNVDDFVKKIKKCRGVQEVVIEYICTQCKWNEEIILLWK